MTSLQLAVDSPVGAVEAAPARVDPSRPPASKEAVRLALHLRDARSAGGSRLLLFVPVSRSGNVAPLVDDVVSGLAELNEGPAMVMDLRASDPGRLRPLSEFAGLFAHARARYSYVLCVADPLSSVETLIAAGLADGVVLSVSPGRTTRSDVQRAAEQLRRNRATVIGFVVDGRAEKGA